jgi:HD-GYP domain-containing protein (c-di-GMP phosphodiesterase class II)
MEPRDPQGTVRKDHIRTADVIGAFSLAADLAMGVPAEHSLRSCYMAMRIAQQLELPHDDRVDLYYTELLVDAGCTAWTSYIAAAIQDDEIAARRAFVFQTDLTSQRAMWRWLLRYVAPREPAPSRVRKIVNFALHRQAHVKEGFQNAFDVAGRLAARLGMSQGVQNALLGLPEHWSAKGSWRSRRDRIPLLSRIAYMTIVLEVAHRSGGRESAIKLARERSGRTLDPLLVEAFLSASASDDFWDPLEGPSVWDVVQAAEPASDYQYIAFDRLTAITETFGDFVDLKAPYMAGHSRRVAQVAETLARRMLLSPHQVRTVGIAAMTHDIGLVAVPSFTLNRPSDQWTQMEWEGVRLHPYYGERILSRAQVLRGAASLVGAHHEREDGRGYYRGAAGRDVPMSACIIAAADRFDELTHDAPGREALSVRQALARMRREETGVQWTACVDALAQDSGTTPGSARKGRRGAQWPADLTDREIEVLRTLAKGRSTRQMAQDLCVSENTVRHHLEHIYAKVGVTTRTAAVVFAMAQGLLS